MVKGLAGQTVQVYDLTTGTVRNGRAKQHLDRDDAYDVRFDDEQQEVLFEEVFAYPSHTAVDEITADLEPLIDAARVAARMDPKHPLRIVQRAKGFW